MFVTLTLGLWNLYWRAILTSTHPAPTFTMIQIVCESDSQQALCEALDWPAACFSSKFLSDNYARFCPTTCTCSLSRSGNNPAHIYSDQLVLYCLTEFLIQSGSELKSGKSLDKHLVFFPALALIFESIIFTNRNVLCNCIPQSQCLPKSYNCDCVSEYKITYSLVMCAGCMLPVCVFSLSPSETNNRFV